MPRDDSIVALSTGPLPSGVAIIRASGPAVPELLAATVGRLPAPRRLVFTPIRSATGELIDRGMAVYFPGPKSFTGEDCAEFHVHGSPAVVRAVLRELCRHEGVRLAEAGEFTRRAFEAGRLDWLEVEGLADMLAAETESQRRLAVARADGALSRRVEAWRQALIGLRAEIEARLDFSDEGDVDDAIGPELLAGLDSLRAELAAALGGAEQGRIVREGFRVALAGPPNVGKSSLINALSRSDVAIVSAEPGTTRDVREVHIDLGGRLVVLVDMAGLRDSESEAEAEGVRRAGAELRKADLVLWLVAPDIPDPGPPPLAVPVWRIGTKADLDSPALLVAGHHGLATVGAGTAATAHSSPCGEGWGGEPGAGVELALSARTGENVEALLGRLAAELDRRGEGGESLLVSRERDRQGLALALALVEEAAQPGLPLELMAEALRGAGFALERLIGRVNAENVLDQLFSRFCIGK